MQHCDKWIDRIVIAWRDYATERPHEIQPSAILRGRDLRMYRAMGIETAEKLARQLVADRSTATLEMSMGHLYERLLEALVTDRVAAVQRKGEGYRGIDFINRRTDAIELVNLKTGLSTSNADITAASALNLRGARDHWQEELARADDNPLGQRAEREVRMVRAVARGPRRHRETPAGIIWMVGDPMWEYFGGGPDFLRRLSDALGRHPLNLARYEEAKESAAKRVENYLTRAGLVNPDGTVDWNRVAEIYD